MSSLNQEIRAAIDSLYPDRARELIRDALKDANAETYYLASLVALDEDQKRDFLQKAVDLDPFHAQAYKALKGLQVEQTASAPPPTPVQNASPPIAPAPPPPVSIPLQTTVPIISPTKIETPPVPEASALMLTTPIQVTVTRSDTSICPIPFEYYFNRQPLPQGIALDVIARDTDPEWLNVGFKQNGSVQIGWVKTSNLSVPRQQSGVVWSLDDLPLADYRYQTWRELSQIINRKGSANKKQGIVFAAVIAACVVFVIAAIVSPGYGVIYGSLVGIGIIVASLYKRAHDLAPLIRQSHVLKRIQKKAPNQPPASYQPYTGWVTPTFEEIEQAERDYAADAQSSRSKAMQNGIGFGVFAAGVMGLLMISTPSEGAVDFVVAFLCFVSLFIVNPIVSYFAVYASDEEKALALVGVVAAAAIFASAAGKTKGSAIQRREEREEAERQARAAAAKARAEAEQKRKEEEARRLEQQRQEQQRLQQQHQQQSHQQSLQRDTSRDVPDWKRQRDAEKDRSASAQQERDWNIKHGYDS